MVNAVRYLGRASSLWDRMDRDNFMVVKELTVSGRANRVEKLTTQIELKSGDSLFIGTRANSFQF